MTVSRDRVWLTHRREELWPVCPLCSAPLEWIRLTDGTYTPCDAEPVLCCEGGRWRLVRWRSLTAAKYRRWKRGDKETPVYARVPHLYTCSVLREERRNFYYMKEK